MPGGVHDMGMTAIEYAESLNQQYKQNIEYDNSNEYGVKSNDIHADRI